MENLSIIILFLFVLFTLLGTGVWVGLALMGVAWVGMELFTDAPCGRCNVNDDLVSVLKLDIDRIAVVHLDGGNPVSNATV